MITIACHTDIDLLQALYDVAAWSNRKGYACKQGCHACCTRSVTMTALEGELILRDLTTQDLKRYRQLIRESVPIRPTMTTNQYIRQFLERRDFSEEEAGWSFEPCPFLGKGSCTIYQIRPFMCRGFVSLTNCREQGFAEVPPSVVTLNTVIQQVIEHLAVGRPWGLMTEVLNAMLAEHKGQTAAMADILTCEEMPGFMIEDRAMPLLKKHLSNIHRLLEASLDGQTPHQALLSQFEQLLC